MFAIILNAMIAVHQHTEHRSALCPYCKAAFRMQESRLRCAMCGTLHHSICWLQNGSHCSVFRCSGASTAAQAMPNTILLRLILTMHSACNIALHFFIHPVGRLLEPIHPADALMLLLMECGIVASGISVLAKLLYNERHREVGGSLSILASVLIGTNVVFFSFLLYVLIVEGMQSLYALVWF